MKMSIYIKIFFLFLILLCNRLHAQKKSKDQSLVYVDKQGVMRWKNTNAEAAFFGVNYTVPFAYGYRSHKALGVDLEKAIQQDVYHLARLGMDAFRVHVWDTEITDSSGNLLENDHLRLYDFLLAELKKRNIKTILTPIAFWGNGYPERDEKTAGFSSLYNKQQAVVNENAISAQENYLKQILKHVNPYTKITYQDDPDIIAAEINNEPHHSGPKEKTTEYINRMVAAMKSMGWTKPIFYNISESPSYAGAVAQANIDGVSFQWYPTGLVANRTLKGNYLPHVDYYRIPFGDTIPQYHNKAKMVYEFDAGDVLQSCMYPAMARSFRTAGFQWATQFAYDPIATAYGNTEYQTHYLNLVYTPSKAISLLIASKVFHRVPRLKNYGSYPADTVFDVFRVSYNESLSEMNSDEEFYYSNSTQTKPVNINKLKHIAGVGNSTVVKYAGTGAYFLDKLGEGVWRLELFPDVIHIRDPFERASPKKEVTRLYSQPNSIQLMLPDLGKHFSVRKLENNSQAFLYENHFAILPGVYILRVGSSISDRQSDSAYKGIEFMVPKPFSTEPFVFHNSYKEVSSGIPFSISAKIFRVDSSDKLSFEFRHSAVGWKTIPMRKITSYYYITDVPSEMLTPGVLNYRAIIQKANDEYFVFPGNHKGNPYSWDNNFINETWQTFIVPGKTPLEIFNVTTDRNEIVFYNPDWRNNTVQYISTEQPGQLALKLNITGPVLKPLFGMQFYFAEKIAGRKNELDSFSKLVIKARTNAGLLNCKMILITNDAESFSAEITISNQGGEYELSLKSFKQDSALLLPRPYPGFLPLWSKPAKANQFKFSNTGMLQLLIRDIAGKTSEKNEIEIESIRVKKE